MSDDIQSVDALSIEEFCQLATDPRQSARIAEALGEQGLRELREVLQGGRRGTARGAGQTVVLLHGIMGSQIGKALRREWDIVWLNPLAIRDGEFARLRVGAGRYGARGLLPLFYSLLWARLKYWYGYKVVPFAYDWRLSVADSAADLVEFLEKEVQGEATLVAHSMGGLVARCALPQVRNRVSRVIQLATPNYGSFVPVLTLRGKNSFVNRILSLDPSATVTDTITNVVSTFEGLYDLFPSPERFSSVDLFDHQLWPGSPAVSAPLLRKAKQTIVEIPPPDPEKLVLIAGTDQQTVTDLGVGADGDFEYFSSQLGDGTVPLEFARFAPDAKVPTYLAKVTHNGILNNGKVATAIDDLIIRGICGLPKDEPGGARTTRTTRRALSTSLADKPFGGRRGQAVTHNEAREALREVLGPLEAESGDEGATIRARGGDAGRGPESLKHVVVSRRRRRMRIVLTQGDITQVSCHAHVLGVFEGVTPTGPSLAYDELLEGAISDLFARRMFSGSRGRVYLMPTYKTPVPGELLVFAGLGGFQEFTTDAAEEVARATVQSLLRVRATEFATVIFGGSFGDVREYLIALLKGFIEGLEESDTNLEFQRIVLCEYDPQKFEDLKEEMYQLVATSLFDRVEVEFDVVQAPRRGEPRTTQRAAELPRVEPAYVISNLLVDTTGRKATTYRHEISVLPPSSGTSFSKLTKDIPKDELDKLIAQTSRGAPADLERFGERLAELILPPELLDSASKTFSESCVHLLHDSLASRIPWEALRLGGAAPAVDQGLVRKYQRDRSTAMFRESRRRDPVLRMLLVYNPTGDLDGAEREGERILASAGGKSDRLQIVPLRREQATRAAILERLRDPEQDFDVLHYAGHAGYVPDNPSQSGLLCADETILSGLDLQPLGTDLPPLIVFNACESGRVRRGREVPTEPVPASAAEAILDAGIMAFIATYWPVSDRGAAVFADKLYEELLEHRTIGQAVLEARQALLGEKEDDWANYMLYGNPDFILKAKSPE